MSNSSVACWGDNSEGQLGNPSAGSSSDYATLVQLPVGLRLDPSMQGLPCVLTGLDGTLVCWGRNTEGQLGRGTCLRATGTGDHAYGSISKQVLDRRGPQLLIGTDSKMYCWGNTSMERTGKVANQENTTYVYENFTDNSRSGPLGRAVISGTRTRQRLRRQALLLSLILGQYCLGFLVPLSIGDKISFRMRGISHGDRGSG